MAVITLEPIAVEDYVRDVLPDTFALWGRQRSFERYADEFRSVANSPYARRRRFTVGIREDGRIAASCKNYDRELRWNEKSLRATGIGAVFTPERLRGRGYASAFLGALLDAERDAGRDLVYLYSDIHPAFYERLGFITLPSRLMTIRAASLDGSAVGALPLEKGDWTGVRRCFDKLDNRRLWSLRRTPLVWDWMRDRWDAAPPDGSQPVHLVIRRGRAVVAYAFGRRVLKEDTYVVDDFGFDGDEGQGVIPALLRAGAGDLRRVGGWLPPAPARAVLPRGSVRVRKNAIFMIAPLSAHARTWWAAVKADALTGRSDVTWSADHV